MLICQIEKSYWDGFFLFFNAAMVQQAYLSYTSVKHSITTVLGGAPGKKRVGDLRDLNYKELLPRESGMDSRLGWQTSEEGLQAAWRSQCWLHCWILPYLIIADLLIRKTKTAGEYSMSKWFWPSHTITWRRRRSGPLKDFLWQATWQVQRICSSV